MLARYTGDDYCSPVVIDAFVISRQGKITSSVSVGAPIALIHFGGPLPYLPFQTQPMLTIFRSLFLLSAAAPILVLATLTGAQHLPLLPFLIAWYTAPVAMLALASRLFKHKQFTQACVVAALVSAALDCKPLFGLQMGLSGDRANASAYIPAAVALAMGLLQWLYRKYVPSELNERARLVRYGKNALLAVPVLIGLYYLNGGSNTVPLRLLNEADFTQHEGVLHVKTGNASITLGPRPFSGTFALSDYRSESKLLRGILHAPDGTSLQCDIVLNQDNSGTGSCMQQGGAKYSVQLRQRPHT